MRKARMVSRMLLLGSLALSAACGESPAGVLDLQVPEGGEKVGGGLWSVSGDCETTLQTPRRSYVNMVSIDSAGTYASWATEVSSTCNAECSIVSSWDPLYSCHSYAFARQDLPTLCKKWLSTADMAVYLNDTSYVETHAGDMCAEIVDTGGHTARIQYCNGNRIVHATYGELVISKWGQGHLVQHYREDGRFPTQDTINYPKYYKRADGSCNVDQASSCSTTTPVAVNISGPITLNAGQSGTWHANPTGGSGSYTCTWELATSSHGWAQVSTQLSYSTTMHSTGGDLRLRATCSSAGSSAFDSYIVTCLDCLGGGDPM